MEFSQFGGDGTLIVFCAANNYDDVKLADQHFAEQLSKLAPVLYVDPPVSVLVPLRDSRMTRQLIGPRMRVLGPGLMRLTPVVEPFPSKSKLVPLTSQLIRASLRRAITRLGDFREIAVISAWPQYRVFGALQEDVRVYWAQDDFVGGAELLGFDAAQLDACERDIAAAADFVVAANPVVADSWSDRDAEVQLIPFGVDARAYVNVEKAPWPADVRLDGPIVGFIGHINARMDLGLLERIADRGRSILLVGPKDPDFEPARFDALVHRPRVSWVGPKEFGELPGYFRVIDVGIVPYGDSPFNRGSFPLKTLEYLAAGKAVVSTDLPATRWLNTELIAVASEANLFADSVDRMLADAGDAWLAARRREFASEHSWPERAKQFHQAIRNCRSVRGGCATGTPGSSGARA